MKRVRSAGRPPPGSRRIFCRHSSRGRTTAVEETTKTRTADIIACAWYRRRPCTRLVSSCRRILLRKSNRILFCTRRSDDFLRAGFSGHDPAVYYRIHGKKRGVAAGASESNTIIIIVIWNISPSASRIIMRALCTREPAAGNIPTILS